MKKIIWAFFLLLLLPNIVYASSYDVEEFLVSANILENGDMEVSELIVVSGNFKTFTRTITYKDSNYTSHDPIEFYNDTIYNGTSLKDITVSMKVLQNNEVASFSSEFTPLTKTYYKEDALDYDYFEKSIQDGKTLTMYYTSSLQRVAFLITYTVSDVVVLHNDIAEIYWSFLKDDFDDDIIDYEVTLNFPDTLLDNTVSFVHGDITGKTTVLTDSINFSFTKIKANTEISLRILFDSSLVSNIILLKTSNITAYDEIIALETKKVKEEINITKRNNTILNLVNSFSLCYLVILLCWWLFVFIRFHLPYKVEVKKIKYPYNVGILDVLINYDVTINGFKATILDLVNREVIKYKNGEFILGNKEGVSYEEELLIDFLFGDEKKVKLSSFADRKSKTVINFYFNWGNCVKKRSLKEHLFEKNGLPIVTSIFFILINIFVLFASVYYNLNTYYPWITFIFTLAFCIYTWLIKKRTKKGQILYKSLMNLKENLTYNPSAVNYVYSVLLGVDVFAKMLEKNPKDKEKLLVLNEVNSQIQKSLITLIQIKK